MKGKSDVFSGVELRFMMGQGRIGKIMIRWCEMEFGK